MTPALLISALMPQFGSSVLAAGWTILASLCLFAILAILTKFLFKLKQLSQQVRAIQNEVSQLPRFVWASQNVQASLAFRQPLPNWNHWTIPPDLLAIIMNLIKNREPQLIVEFGSGLSTIVIASLIRGYGGKLISIEHDAGYAETQRKALICHGLSEHVEVRVSPIGSRTYEPFRHPWYEIPDFADLANVDLVVVDGPPDAFGAEVRFPGAEQMVAKLAPGGSIILDDVDRAGEQRIKAELLRRHPDLTVDEPRTIRGCLILTKPS